MKTIEQYLSNHAKVWSPTTLRSETYRMRTIEPYISDPQGLWEALQSLAPYTRRTYFIRARKYHDWVGTSPNPFTKFMEENAQLFRHVYEKKRPDMALEEAKGRIAQIKDSQARDAAMLLLSTGMRTCELKSYDGKTVVGKGGKRREVYGGKKPVRCSYKKLYKHLVKVGLKPHDLRKIFATELVRNGANEFELTHIMGWSDINVALSYVNSDNKKLSRLVGNALGE